MHGSDDERPPEIDGGKARRQRRRQHGVAGQSGLDVPQCVDPGIAGHVDDACRNAFAEQRGSGPRRQREMQVGDLGDGAAVHFLGKRLGLARPQPGLDMNQRPARIGRRLRPGKGRGGSPWTTTAAGRMRSHSAVSAGTSAPMTSAGDWADRMIARSASASRPKPASASWTNSRCCPVAARNVARPRRRSARMTGESFTASGRVPATNKKYHPTTPYPHLSTLIQVQCCRKGTCSFCQY
jgi:hypothetical protein